ncbi:MAG: hypothetical protein AB7K24_33800 [Gemmataceae bacterium]
MFDWLLHAIATYFRYDPKTADHAESYLLPVLILLLVGALILIVYVSW